MIIKSFVSTEQEKKIYFRSRIWKLARPTVIKVDYRVIVASISNEVNSHLPWQSTNDIFRRQNIKFAYITLQIESISWRKKKKERKGRLSRSPIRREIIFTSFFCRLSAILLRRPNRASLTIFQMKQNF